MNMRHHCQNACLHVDLRKMTPEPNRALVSGHASHPADYVVKDYNGDTSEEQDLEE